MLAKIIYTNNTHTHTHTNTAMEFSKYNQKDIYAGLQFLIIIPHKQLLISTVISSNTITYGALHDSDMV